MKKEKMNIKIRSLQANRIYQVQNGYKYRYGNQIRDCRLEWNDAMLNDSLFLRYMKKHGMKIKKDGSSLDFIVLKFDYSVLSYCEQELYYGYNDGEQEENAEVNTEDLLSGIKDSVSAKELRQMYYTQGCTITWHKYNKKTGDIIHGADETITYRMLMRSPGKAKKGDCVFVREELLTIARDYLTMGLWDRMPQENADIVSLSAYSTLITASALGYIHIPLKNILIVRDQEVSTILPGLTVDVDESNHCYVKKEEQCEITNILWDGMGLIDDSIFPEDQWMDGFLYCRSHFFKSCFFRGNVVQYFMDYYKEDYSTAAVMDMFGNKVKVSDIRVIVTENSIKWMRFKRLMKEYPEDNDSKAYKYYRHFMKKDGEMFSIVKTGHESKWGELQRSSYQINNSLPTTDKEMLAEIAQTSVDYYNRMVQDHDAFMEHLKRTSGNKYSVGNMLIALDEWNHDFRYTDYFKKKKSEILSEFKNKRLKLGKLLQSGDNLVICGNPLALLKQVTGEGYSSEKCFDTHREGIECYTSRFPDGQCLAGFRSPHNSSNNIVHLINRYPQELMRYFPELGQHVIVINGIGTDVQDRLNGQDLDSDSVYVTDQEEIVKLSEKAYLEYPTIINRIPLKNSSLYNMDMASFAEMDYKIARSQNDIGTTSNLAQLALSYYFDGRAADREGELQDIFVICSVLAQVAIDSAKREFNVSVGSELGRLNKVVAEIGENINGSKKYPRFYAGHMKMKGKCEITENQVGKFNCPMDIVYDLVDEMTIDSRVNKEYQTRTIPVNSLLLPYNKGDANRKQYQKIVSEIEAYDAKVKNLDKAAEDYSEKISYLFAQTADRIRKHTIKQDTMMRLVDKAFHDPCLSRMRSRLLTLLYDNNPQIFLLCFVKNAEK